MTVPLRRKSDLTDDKTVEREARRILRRLCENGAFLAVAPDFEKAVVLKETPGGDTARIGVVSRGVAEAFVLKDWIELASNGRVTTYRVTTAGRAALKRFLVQDGAAAAADAGFAEAAMPFADQHRDWSERSVAEAGGTTRKLRYNLGESPLSLLSRRKDKDGKPFLSPDLVGAGERLREDFELAQMGPRVTQNWDRFLTAGDRGGFRPEDAGMGRGPAAARDRVAAALADLGPGLGDVALRCCCFLEGLETAEKRMGWSARSGKIVLRIALQRLKCHYDTPQGRKGDLIG